MSTSGWESNFFSEVSRYFLPWSRHWHTLVHGISWFESRESQHHIVRKINWLEFWLSMSWLPWIHRIVSRLKDNISEMYHKSPFWPLPGEPKKIKKAGTVTHASDRSFFQKLDRSVGGKFCVVYSKLDFGCFSRGSGMSDPNKFSPLMLFQFCSNGSHLSSLRSSYLPEITASSLRVHFSHICLVFLLPLLDATSLVRWKWAVS